MMYPRLPRLHISNGATEILLHDWEDKMRKYLAQGWQCWPYQKEGQYRARELNISDRRNAILYDLLIRPEMQSFLTTDIDLANVQSRTSRLSNKL